MWWDGSSAAITHCLCLPLKKTLKKMRNKSSIWHLLTLRNYSQGIAIFSGQYSKYIISTADRQSKNYCFLRKPSRQPAWECALLTQHLSAAPPLTSQENLKQPHVELAKLYANHLRPHKLSFMEQNKDFIYIYIYLEFSLLLHRSERKKHVGGCR